MDAGEIDVAVPEEVVVFGRGGGVFESPVALRLGVDPQVIARRVGGSVSGPGFVRIVVGPELVEVITGRVIIPDGTLIPTCNRAAHPELYSGKRHRSGAAVQILSGTDGRLRHVGEPIAGSIHDIRAFRETGLAAILAEHMDNHLVIADLGYRGEPVCTPVKKPPKGELSPAQIEANKHLSGIRSAVERAIAHLKNWKILATGYRRPLRKLAPCLVAVAALEFYRLNWTGCE